MYRDCGACTYTATVAGLESNHGTLICALCPPCCQVTLSDSRVYEAEVKGKDREKDVAVLRLKGVPPQVAAQLTPVVLGSSSNLLVGQKVGGGMGGRGGRGSKWWRQVGEQVGGSHCCPHPSGGVHMSNSAAKAG
jgi:hypothetical protein